MALWTIAVMSNDGAAVGLVAAGAAVHCFALRTLFLTVVASPSASNSARADKYSARQPSNPHEFRDVKLLLPGPLSAPSILSIKEGASIMAAERIEAHQAHDDIGMGALLVCAYDDQAKFEKFHLDGAMSLPEFRASKVPKDREILFYCA
jgi:hypothetical protein